MPTITDDKGNSYVKLVEQDAATTGVAQFLAKNITGSTAPTITATANGGNTFLSLGVSDYIGQNQTTQAGATNSGTGTTGTTTPTWRPTPRFAGK